MPDGLKKHPHGKGRTFRAVETSRFLREKHGIRCNGRDAILFGVVVKQSGRDWEPVTTVTVSVGHLPGGEAAAIDMAEVLEEYLRDGGYVVSRNEHILSVYRPIWRGEPEPERPVREQTVNLDDITD